MVQVLRRLRAILCGPRLSSTKLAISSSFDSTRNIYVIKLSGSPTVDEVVDCYEAVFDHPDFKPNMAAIWDLTSLNLKQVEIGDIRQLPRELGKYMQKRGDDYKAALVVSRATDFYLLRMYVTILRLIGSNIHFRLHRTMDEAYAWVLDKEAA